MLSMYTYQSENVSSKGATFSTTLPSRTLYCRWARQGTQSSTWHLTPGLRCNQQCMYVYRLVPTVIGIPHAHSRITHLCSMHTAAQEPGTTCSRNYTWQYTTEIGLGHCCQRSLAHKLQANINTSQVEPSLSTTNAKLYWKIHRTQHNLQIA